MINMKNRYKISLAIIFIVSSFAISNYTYAEISGNNDKSGINGNNPPAGNTQSISYLQNPLKAKNVTDLLYSMVDIAIFIGAIFAVFMFIFVGFKFVSAQGDTSALKDARNWFFYVVIGTAILISSKVIVEVLKNTFISAGVVNQDLFNKQL